MGRLPLLLALGLVALVLLGSGPDSGPRRLTAPPLGATVTTVPFPFSNGEAASPRRAVPNVLQSPLFADLVGGTAAPVAVTTSAPPQVEDTRLLAAVARALPLLGGQATAAWGTPTAVGPVLHVRWQPGVGLNGPQAIQEAVVAAVETVVQSMDREFPGGFRGAQGTALAAVQVDVPEQEGVLVAVRTYRDLATGEATADEFARQWRLLGRRAAAEAPARAARQVPDQPSAGAPERWPPRIARFYDAVLQAAIRYQIDPDLLAAIMQQESGGEPAAVGSWAWIPHMGRYERAIGLMQVMPNEAERRGVPSEEAWDYDKNILLGARVLRDKLDVIRGDFWTRVQGYYGFGDPLSDYWLDRIYANWLAFRQPR